MTNFLMMGLISIQNLSVNSIVIDLLISECYEQA
jgi:hypothetical protein